MQINNNTKAEELRQATYNLVEENVIPTMRLESDNQCKNDRKDYLCSLKMFLNILMKKGNDDTQKVLRKTKKEILTTKESL